MSKCDLSIEFDSSERKFRPGDTVSGKVHVQVNAKCQCNGLKVGTVWHTHGRGNYTEGGRSEEVVFSGEWWPGETHSYPFSFEAPRTPVTYHGTLVNVDHYVVARADIPWALDPKVEEDYVLLPGPTSVEPSPDLTKAMQITSRALGGAGAACGVIFGLIFFCAGMVPVGAGVISFLDGEFVGVVAIPFGAIFMIVGGGIAFLAMRKVLAERKLGPVEVTLNPRTPNPGDTVEVEVRFSPRGRVTLNEVTATLKGEEVAVSGSGTNSTTHRHELHDEIQQILEARDLFTEEATLAKGTFVVPADAAPSFAATDNRVEWKVQVHIDIARWPDWQSAEILAVAPQIPV